MTDGAPFHSALDNSPESIQKSILHHLKFTLARDRASATRHDWYLCTVRAIQDRIVERLMATQSVHNRENVKRVYYLSLEFLMGRLFGDTLYHSQVFQEVKEALEGLGLDIEEIRDEEYDMGLGNGGLGRLAACFLDSMATLDYPAIGYGIQYEFGLFKQEFHNGHQVEFPDEWMKFGHTPWELCRPEFAQTIHVYGHVENDFNDFGECIPKWVNTKAIQGVPYDIPIAGYETNTVNFLRLWESKSADEFDLEMFNQGGYVEAVQDQNRSETVSKVLYPNDQTENGKELRLIQQYFFVACSLKDIIRRYRKFNKGWETFHEKVAVQLNDTHPAVAVAELMRMLLDEEYLEWDEAWGVVTKTFAYTNHTLLPEALERWSVPLFGKVLPRHLQIIFEINQRFLKDVDAKWPGDAQKQKELSLIEEGNPKMIRMAHLAVVGSHTVNGVAALHSKLLKESLFKGFHELYPERIQNKTNGITPRRWIQTCNQGLTQLIDSRIGKGWVKNLERIREIEQYADDEEFQNQFRAVKRANKEDLAKLVKELCDVEISPEAIFDVQIKRLHEYKRQHLNLLHILSLYRQILKHPDADIYPRVFIFAAKAAPGYELAKNIIKAINAVGEKVNHDPRVKGRLKVVFLPNYRVSLAQRIIPAADVSEQISLAGKEASGTGNMKLALNGAVTIGTLDGANVEIKEEVGDDNIFIFGMTVKEVKELQANGYDPYHYYCQNEELKAVVDWLASNYFTPDEHGALLPLYHRLLDGGDPFMALADYESYCQAHRDLEVAYRDERRWNRMAILNTARVSKFSSDRTIHEYAKDIWKLPQVVT